ncbi:prepilin-type N-terminal cleavage/methylation domain-containing protein [Sporosarcina koreensis]|uniref:prepilin-type N-terminal cleavage/methylation domain-containing protein n=1 Tax=Sporosarcina koreensis TaxID=334735 RepID=UPI00058D2EB5|nr:prepilin-type N-terminal cleavage/methylation domain-containing protein [Sporosarcina koreensis]
MEQMEEGMTLVEVLAALVLVALVSGIIWSVISIASQFNLTETSTLRLQQEANLVITDLQQVHRHCDTYRLIISEEKVQVESCRDSDGQSLGEYNKVISDAFQYRAGDSAGNKYVDRTYSPTKENLELPGFTVLDTMVRPGHEKAVTVPTTISRYRTKDRQKP